MADPAMVMTVEVERRWWGCVARDEEMGVRGRGLPFSSSFFKYGRKWLLSKWCGGLLELFFNGAASLEVGFACWAVVNPLGVGASLEFENDDDLCKTSLVGIVIGDRGEEDVDKAGGAYRARWLLGGGDLFRDLIQGKRVPEVEGEGPVGHCSLEL